MLPLSEIYNLVKPGDGTVGVIEFIIKDKNGNVVDHIVEKNVIKIFAKEMLSHRLPSSEIWDPSANGGSGGWVNNNIDPDEEYSVRYILFGATFDSSGTALGTDDTRFYQQDAVTGQFVPIRLTPSASNDGGLINAIPISDPDRPLKRIESVSFNNTYQPTGSPLVDSDVRALNNVVVFETVMNTDEYNGFSNTASDFFTISEVALAGGRRFDSSVGSCGLVPRDLFLQGVDSTTGSVTSTEYEVSVAAIANGTNVISIDSSEPASSVSLFKKGDQIKIVDRDGTQDSHDDLNQINPYYLVIGTSGGRDLELDRVPVDTNGAALVGGIGVFRDTLKIFSHRILSTPVSKSESFEITSRWTIVFN